MKNTYAKTGIKDFWGIFCHELRQIFSDSGVLLIFLVAGLVYPLLYNVVYLNGILSETPVAIVDNCDSPDSHPSSGRSTPPERSRSRRNV